MDRSNPYEAAFEEFLQEQGLCYVAVDETRRAVLGDVPVKNLDFIILGITGARLLVDVKGRQFPGGPPEKPRYVWESWATEDDIHGLTQWQSLFGADYQPLFVFMYNILPTVSIPEGTPDLWQGKHGTYLLRAVPLQEYRENMRVRSPKWQTVDLPTDAFRKVARPFRYFSHECPSSTPTEEQDGPGQTQRLFETTRAVLQALAAGSSEAWRQSSRDRGDGGVGSATADSNRPS